MKALSIHPEYAMNIIKGLKTIEVRTWTTKYRGDILICSTAKKGRGLIDGHALGVVTLSDIVPMRREHARAAMVSPYEDWTGCYAWVLKNPRPINPFPMKGKLSLWECDHEIEVLSAPAGGAPLQNFCDKYWRGFLKGSHAAETVSRNKSLNDERNNEKVELPLYSDNDREAHKNKSTSKHVNLSENQNNLSMPNRGYPSEIKMDTIKVINNITETLKDDLQTTIRRNSRV